MDRCQTEQDTSPLDLSGDLRLYSVRYFMYNPFNCRKAFLTRLLVVKVNNSHYFTKSHKVSMEVSGYENIWID
jgi:hypothetical protein